jgi:hypothetical protein
MFINPYAANVDYRVAPNNASKWQMGLNWVFKGLRSHHYVQFYNSVRVCARVCACACAAHNDWTGDNSEMDKKNGHRVLVANLKETVHMQDLAVDGEY